MNTACNEPTFSRQHLVLAIELELGIQSDGRLASSAQGAQLLTNAVLSKLNNSGNIGTGILTSLAANNPVAALAVGAIGLAAAARFSSKYPDYGTQPEGLAHAFRIVMYATTDQIAQLNHSVTGGLTRFVDERIITPFQVRLSALSEISKGNSEQSQDVTNRIAIYQAGINDARQLQQLLQARLRFLVAEKEGIENSAREEAASRKQEIHKALEQLELNYKAGMVNHSQYHEQKMIFKLQNTENNITSFANKLDAHIKDTSLVGGKTVIDFANEFFCPIIEQSIESKERSFFRYVILAICILFCLFFIIDFMQH